MDNLDMGHEHGHNVVFYGELLWYVLSRDLSVTGPYDVIYAVSIAHF